MNTNYDEILKIAEQKFKYLNYSPHTQRNYLHYIAEFLKTTNKYVKHLTANDYETYLHNYQFKSVSQQNQIISALKFFYEKVLNRKYGKVNFERPRKEKKLPIVIDGEILKQKILSIQNKKHKALLALAYGCGLRVSEVINLKIVDIDSDRMILKIKQAKGKKDRIVTISEELLSILRSYYKNYRPKIYLFNGQKSLQYSRTSCNKIVKHYISNRIHMHTLRHSSFTNLLESGTDIRIIQKIAGHSSIKTTEHYTKVSSRTLRKIKMPL